VVVQDIVVVTGVMEVDAVETVSVVLAGEDDEKNVIPVLALVWFNVRCAPVCEMFATTLY